MSSRIVKIRSSILAIFYKIPFFGYCLQILIGLVRYPHFKKHILSYLSLLTVINHQGNRKLKQIEENLRQVKANIRNEISVMNKNLTVKDEQMDINIKTMEREVREINDRLKKINERIELNYSSQGQENIPKDQLSIKEMGEKLKKVEEVLPAFLNIINSTSSTLRSFRRDLDHLKRIVVEPMTENRSSTQEIWENITKKSSLSTSNEKVEA